MRYTARKILTLLVTMLVVSLLTFAAFDMISGDPAATLLGTQATPEKVEALRAEKEALQRQERELQEWQEETDSEEDLQCLPHLTLADIQDMPEDIPTEVRDMDGTKVLVHDIPTGGIGSSILPRVTSETAVPLYGPQ